MENPVCILIIECELRTLVYTCIVKLAAKFTVNFIRLLSKSPIADNVKKDRSNCFESLFLKTNMVYGI